MSTSRMESCIWVVGDKKIFGISLSKLKELGKEEELGKEDGSYESLSGILFDRPIRLPENQMRPFSFDNKMYLLGGFNRYSYPTSRIYHIDIHSRKITQAPSISPAPTLTWDAFVENIDGNVYLLAIDNSSSMKDRNVGLWVLPRFRHQPHWKFLAQPPPINHDPSNLFHCFVIQKKFFFFDDNFPPPSTRDWSRSRGDRDSVKDMDIVGDSDSGAGKDDEEDIFHDDSEEDSDVDVDDYTNSDNSIKEVKLPIRVPSLCYFDTRTARWTPVDEFITKSLYLDDDFYYPEFTMSSAPGGIFGSVSFSHSIFQVGHRLADNEYQVKVKALLLDNDWPGYVLAYQSMEECFVDDLKFADCTTIYLKFVDFGNGMICALLNGSTLGYQRVLCISVFTVSEALEEEDLKEKQRRFLSIDVHVKRVFTVTDSVLELLQGAFILP